MSRKKVPTNLNHGFRSGYSTETQLAVTIDDLAKRSVTGQQTDVAILNFSKEFQHGRLLLGLKSTSIRDQLLFLDKKTKATSDYSCIFDNSTS